MKRSMVGFKLNDKRQNNGSRNKANAIDARPYINQRKIYRESQRTSTDEINRRHKGSRRITLEMSSTK